MSNCFAASSTVAHQAYVSIRFPRQEYSGGFPLPSPGHLPNPGIAPTSPDLTGVFFTTWRRKWQPTPVPLPGKSHEGRSLVGYSPWGREDSDTTERLHFHFLSLLLSHLGSPRMLSCSVVSNSLRPHALEPARLLCLWDFPGKSTRVGSHSLLQGSLYVPLKYSCCLRLFLNPHLKLNILFVLFYTLSWFQTQTCSHC